MAKRKAENQLEGVRKKRVVKPSYKTQHRTKLMERKKELRKEYKKLQAAMKQVDKDLKSLGYTIRKK